MLQEIKNNVYNAEMVVSDGENRYTVFEPDWNGEYWEAALCTENGNIVKGKTVRLFPVQEHDEEHDVWEIVGYEIR